MKRTEIQEAYLFLRKYNHSISSEMLDFIYKVSLEAFDEYEEEVKSELWRIDPEDCGCTDCILGESKPVDRCRLIELEGLIMGRYDNATGLTQSEIIQLIKENS